MPGNFRALSFMLLAVAGPAIAASTSTKVAFVYDDLDRYAAAHSALDQGTEPEAAMKAYVDQGSAAFKFYAKRYDVSAQGIAAEIAKRPKFYRRLAGLKPRLQAHEPLISASIDKLNVMAGQRLDVPIHFLVANQVAGGTPVELDSADPPAVGVAIAIDMVSLAPDVDMTEFAAGPGGRAALEDIPYVAIHETVHVHQVEAQGGLDNYRSIYRPGPNSSNLAVAIREGCADYLTFLASGIRRSGAQANYGAANERLLWTEFQKVMNAPAFSAPGWFSGTDPRYPQWPSQIGYWLGDRMCEHYHQSAADKQKAVRDLFAAYRPDEVQKFAEAYGRKFAD